MAEGLSARKGDVVVLVGTRKGSFLFSSGPSRKQWEFSGPHFPGGDVFHMTYDSREGGKILAAVNHMVWGSEVHLSTDLGGTWLSAEQQPRFGDQSRRTVQRLWHLEPGREGETGVLYAGVEPAALFKSEDDGATWREVVGLSKSPYQRPVGARLGRPVPCTVWCLTLRIPAGCGSESPLPGCLGPTTPERAGVR